MIRKGTRVVVVGKGLATKGWVGKVVKVDASAKGWPFTVEFGKVNCRRGEYAATELARA